MKNRPKNVLLVTIDALRSDHLSFMNYSRDTSPFLNSLGRRGAVFTRAYSNSCWTAPAFPPIFSSDYPVLGKRYGIQGRTIIQEVLRNHGYQTAAFHSNPFLSRVFGYDRGFDHFEDHLSSEEVPGSAPKPTKVTARMRLGDLVRGNDLLYRSVSLIRKPLDRIRPKKTRVPYVEAMSLTEEAVSWLYGASRRPFFMWLHYMEPHSSAIYAPDVGQIRGNLNKRELRDRLYVEDKGITVCVSYLADILMKYDARIRYADLAIEKLCRALQDGGYFEDTLIIVTADHGEEFLDHGHFGHRPKLYEELIHVPLLLAGPGVPEGLRSDKIVQHVDIAPTVLELLGLPVPSEFLGKNVFSEKERHGIFSEVGNEAPRNKVDIDMSRLRVAYVERDWKYIHYAAGQDELYCLAEDPNERTNLIDSRRDIGSKYRDMIQEHIAAKRGGEKPRDSKERSIARLKKLKSTGRI